MALRTCAQPLLAQARALRPQAPPLLSLARRYHATPRLAAYKDDQDRQSLKPRRAEGTKSGTDDEVAQTDAAFNPKKTSPEEAKASAASNGNPLDASGANREFSKSPKPDAAVAGSGEKPKSGPGKGKKHGKPGPV